MLHRGPFKQYDVRGLAPILLRLKEGCVQWHLLNPGGGVSDPVQLKVVHFQTITNIIPHGRRPWKESLAASGFSRTLQLQREIPASSHCCETLQGLLDSTQWEWQYSHSKPTALWDMFLLCVFFFFAEGLFAPLWFSYVAVWRWKRNLPSNLFVVELQESQRSACDRPLQNFQKHTFKGHWQEVAFVTQESTTGNLTWEPDHEDFSSAILTSVLTASARRNYSALL